MLNALSKFALIALLAFSFFQRSVTPAAAQGPREWSGVCVEDVEVSKKDQNGDTEVENVRVATVQGAQCLVANVLSVAVIVIGLAGFVMMLIGAFRFMLSGGNTKNTESARQTITFAIVGLVVALSAFIIINLLAAFTGISLLRQFIIPDSDTPWTDV